MALLKAIKQQNGVILNYHRINGIRNIVNDNTYIDILSYVDEEEREKDKKYAKYSPNRAKLLIYSSFVQIPYNDTLTIQDAYEYLKTLPEFEGSEDV